jgi:hypothetical protein
MKAQLKNSNDRKTNKKEEEKISYWQSYIVDFTE